MPEEKREVGSTEYKTTSGITKQTNPRTFTFVFSTPDVDRDHDVILADGIDIKAFKKNPVVLWAHDRRTPPVARVKSIFWRKKQLVGAVEFPTLGTYQLADTLHDLVAAKYLNAVSIGFMPVEWSYDEDRGGYNFQKTELLEVSLVPVGSNRRALHEAAAKGISTEAVKVWAKGVLEDPEVPEVEEVVELEEEIKEELVEENIEKEPEPIAAEPSGQDDTKEDQQDPEDKSAGNGEQTEEPEKVPCLSYDEAVSEIRAATQVGIAEQVKRFVNYWSGRLD